MDTMMSFNSQNLAEHFLTSEEIHRKCPLAYAVTPTNPSVSDRYVQANTSTVIDDMAKLGWGVVDAKQRKARKNSSGIYSYHMVCFQNPKIRVMKKNEDGESVVECYPRIILTNSHDGMNSFRFMVGLFRLVCSNGLVIASDKFVDIRIRHINYTFDELRNTITMAIKELPNEIAVINQMKQVELTESQKYDLALQMLKIRKDIAENEKYNVDEDTLDKMLTPVRTDDNGDDLWSVFNVLQEKVIKGGFKAPNAKGDKLRKMRKVTSFVKDLDLNQKMFSTALSYLPDKMAA